MLDNKLDNDGAQFTQTNYSKKKSYLNVFDLGDVFRELIPF